MHADLGVTVIHHPARQFSKQWAAPAAQDIQHRAAHIPHGSGEGFHQDGFVHPHFRIDTGHHFLPHPEILHLKQREDHGFIDRIHIPEKGTDNGRPVLGGFAAHQVHHTHNAAVLLRSAVSYGLARGIGYGTVHVVKKFPKKESVPIFELAQDLESARQGFG